MRERLVLAFVGLTVVIVALYGIPRAYFLADLVRSQEQDRVDRTATVVAVAVAERVAGGGALDRAFLNELASEDESITVTGSAAEVTSSLRVEEDPSNIWAQKRVPEVGTVKVIRAGHAVDDAVAQALLPLVLLGIGLVVLAGGIGFLLARWFARPFTDLATAARDLGAGTLAVTLPPYKVPEAQEIALALKTSGRRLEALLQHEGDLAVHASHELRTPITAVRLELEDLALSSDPSPETAATLNRIIAELDRLSDAVSELLETSKDLVEGEIDLDLDALVADTVARIAGRGRTVAHQPHGPLPTRLDPAPLVQALEALLVDGGSVTTADRGTHLEITVTPAAGPEPGATELIAAVGGHLSRTETGALLRVPKRPLAGPAG